MGSGPELILGLSWYQPEQVQKTAIETILADSDYDVTLLLQPMRKKAYWENAAICLQQIGYPRNLPALDGMLEWLQDMNWPGAEIVRKLLESYPKEALLPAYERAVAKAFSAKDECWLGWLSYYGMVKKFLREEFQNPNLFDEMMRLNNDYFVH